MIRMESWNGHWFGFSQVLSTAELAPASVDVQPNVRIHLEGQDAVTAVAPCPFVQGIQEPVPADRKSKLTSGIWSLGPEFEFGMDQ